MQWNRSLPTSFECVWLQRIFIREYSDRHIIITCPDLRHIRTSSIRSHAQLLFLFAFLLCSTLRDSSSGSLHTLSCLVDCRPPLRSLLSLSDCRTPTRERWRSRRVWRLDLLVCHIYDIVYIAGGRAFSCFNFPLNLCCTCTVLKSLVTSVLKRAVGHCLHCLLVLSCTVLCTDSTHYRCLLTPLVLYQLRTQLAVHFHFIDWFDNVTRSIDSLLWPALNPFVRRFLN